MQLNQIRLWKVCVKSMITNKKDNVYLRYGKSLPDHIIKMCLEYY